MDENTCPCFLFSSRADTVVPIQNTLDMMNALNRFQTSFECHIYPYGPHGFSTGAPSVQGLESIFPRRAGDWVNDSIAFLRDLFGNFGSQGMTEPVLRSHVNDDAMAWLSLDCSIARIFGNPEARRVLASTITKMRDQITPFSPEMSFEDMIGVLGKMTLRELLAERSIDTERFEELNAALHKIPNI